MTRVLLFGDSLSHFGADAAGPVYDVPSYTAIVSSAPGVVLARSLTELGHSVRINARVSRSAWNFWDREPTEILLEQDAAWKPELVVVWLGTNDIGISSVRTRDAMIKIREAYEGMGAKVIAIGPPAFADQELREGATVVYATMRNAFSTVIDARPASLALREAPYRARDGVHFTARGAELLGTRLADDVAAPGASWWPAAIALGLALLIATITGGPLMR